MKEIVKPTAEKTAKEGLGVPGGSGNPGGSGVPGTSKETKDAPVVPGQTGTETKEKVLNFGLKSNTLQILYPRA